MKSIEFKRDVDGRVFKFEFREDDSNFYALQKFFFSVNKNETEVELDFFEAPLLVLYFALYLDVEKTKKIFLSTGLGQTSEEVIEEILERMEGYLSENMIHGSLDHKRLLHQVRGIELDLLSGEIEFDHPQRKVYASKNWPWYASIGIIRSDDTKWTLRISKKVMNNF